MSSNSDDSILGGKAGDLEESTTSNNNNSSGIGSTDTVADEKKEIFVRKESRYVLYLRLVVILVLLVAAVAVSILVHSITSNGEEDSFEANYNAAAEKVTDIFMNIAKEKLGAAGSLVVAIIANEMALGEKWPFVTLSSFQERTATIMKLSGALSIGVNPLVKREERDAWEEYSNYDSDAADWYRDAMDYMEKREIDHLDGRSQIVTDDPELLFQGGMANRIFYYDYTNGKVSVNPEQDWYLPIWQGSPASVNQATVNQNVLSNSVGANLCMKNRTVAFDGMILSTPGYSDDPNPITSSFAWLLSAANEKRTKYDGDVLTMVYFPIFSNFSSDSTTVGAMWVIIHWAEYFRNQLPSTTRGVVVVLESCVMAYTYRIDGSVVTPLGVGDLHDTDFEEFKRTASFIDVKSVEDGTASGLPIDHNNCPFSIRIYPSRDFQNEYNTRMPWTITLSVLAVFVFAVLMFFIYDRLVERRQSLLLRKATQTHDIVASLFPKNVRDQLLQERDDKKVKGHDSSSNRLKTYLHGEDDDNEMNQAPIADLYPNATVLFADISGFTAWSSSREPAQVFILLQNVYKAFDVIARQRNVFKVETIGDSYVAVTGLPDPQPNHALIMARFAWECLYKVTDITRNLETILGPGTGELTMRFGLHSGPVTAGVLRGERSRFQLFGDTVNTAARMESTGIPGRIQCSQATAELLSHVGKSHWLEPRKDDVVAKGKGVLKTFWLTPLSKNSGSSSSSETGEEHAHSTVTSQTNMLLQHERLVDWIVEIFKENIRNIAAKHAAAKISAGPVQPIIRTDGKIPLDEIVEAVRLPGFDAKSVVANAETVEIPRSIVESLRDFVSIIASTYRDNPFHNFEHACQVTLSVSKFLKRIVAPNLEIDQMGTAATGKAVNTMSVELIASQLHDYTHGLTSDPITIFAIVFSALIHDVDHRGVSNVQLMKEEPAMATTFRNQSIAEQNSLDISWELFMTDRFQNLRDFIFANQDELRRFRQVVVNVVLATDIFDKEINAHRAERWENAFSSKDDSGPLPSYKSRGSPRATILREHQNALRATIVMEHIIQASDVCHTMQHWQIYRKWNKRLFMEMCQAHLAGRMAVDPASFWYQGELNFFDNYIIPLAKKLKDCNVFGVSSDECLNYAMRNREEWEARGKDMITEMLEEIEPEPERIAI